MHVKGAGASSPMKSKPISVVKLPNTSVTVLLLVRKRYPDQWPCRIVPINDVVSLSSHHNDHLISRVLVSGTERSDTIPG
jgi:hypothetical protein